MQEQRVIEFSEEWHDLFLAMVNVQDEVGVIHTDKVGHLGNKYASMPKLILTLKPVLDKNGLKIMQPLVGSMLSDNTGVCTIIYHLPSKQWMRALNLFPAPAPQRGINASQALGASISYQKRYAILSAFGLIADDEIDAEMLSPTKAAETAAVEEESVPDINQRPYTRDALIAALKSSFRNEKIKNGKATFDGVLKISQQHGFDGKSILTSLWGGKTDGFTAAELNATFTWLSKLSQKKFKDTVIKEIDNLYS